MSYGRVLTPRFYTDSINFYASRGVSRSSLVEDIGAASVDSGYSIYQSIDMNPTNPCQWATDATGDTVSIRIDFGEAVTCDYVAIMGHNLDTTGGKIRIARSATEPSSGGGTVPTGISDYFNANDLLTGYYSVDEDGDTILSFSDNSYRYWLIEFEDVSSWSGDLQIGAILLGNRFNSPVAVDNNYSRSMAFDGVQTSRAYAGKDFATASHLGPSSGDYAPFLDADSTNRFGARRSYNLTVSFIGDDDLFPSDHADSEASVNFSGTVFNKVGGSFLPFIFQPSITSTTKGDFLWARVGNEITTSRVGHNVETVTFDVMQVF